MKVYILHVCIVHGKGYLKRIMLACMHPCMLIYVCHAHTDIFFIGVNALIKFAENSKKRRALKLSKKSASGGMRKKKRQESDVKKKVEVKCTCMYMHTRMYIITSLP